MKAVLSSFLLLICLVFGLLWPDSSPGIKRSYISGNNQAVRLLESGDYLGGIELLRQSLAKAPDDELVRANLRNAYLAAGIALTRQQDYGVLSRLMLEARQFDDQQRSFWTMSGHALLRLQRYDDAEIDLLKAQSLGAPDAQIYYLLGQLYYATDRMEEAFYLLESATLIDTQDSGIRQMFEKVGRELAVERKMDKAYGGHFVITFDGGENTELGEEVLAALEEAYNSLSSRFDHYQDQRVTVILYSRRQFRDLTSSPDWAGGLYDGKIRLPVGGISRVDEQVRKLLYHEYLHVILHDIAGKNVPTWLNEGLAETVAREIAPQRAREDLLKSRPEQLFALKALEGSFGKLSGRQALLAYEQSCSFVRYLIMEYGWYRVRELVFVLADGLEISAAIDKVFGIYGVDYQSLEISWRESL
jgi:tetratricopeptide (TPR) repeat protein